MYLPVSGMEPTSSVFRDKCFNYLTTVADEVLPLYDILFTFVL